MSGLFGELQRTSQALAAQSQGIYTAGRNMANVNNAAYARQRVQVGDRGMVQTPLGAQSLGIGALALQNIRDQLLDRQVVRETSLAGSLATEAAAYEKAQLAFGQTVDRQGDAQFIDGASTVSGSHGVGEALSDLLDAFSSLSANPRSVAERQALYQKAETLVSRVRTTEARLAAVQQDIDSQISSDLVAVNDLLETISSINQQIGRFEIGNPGSALDLRDQRQAKLEELSKFIDIDVEELPGSVGQIRILSRDTSDAPVVLLDRGNPPGAVGFDGSSVTAGSPPVALQLRGGSLQGGLKARDGTVAALRVGLDQLAAQIVGSVNSAYNPGGVSTDFFTAGGVTAATIALDPSLSAAGIRSTNSTDPGANEVALAISELASRSFSIAGGDAIDGTFGSFYRGLVSDVANATASAQGRLDDQSTLQRLVLERRDGASGVSLDEEMTDLIRYQRAFDASARVMRVIDEMLETIVSGLVQ